MSAPLDTLDALIIGGGPAGLAAAIVLGRAGCSVVVCERRALPADKACGEGVMPTGMSLLARLGAAARLDSEQMHPLRGVTFRTERGAVATADFTEGPGHGIRRTNLSQALLAEVRQHPSVEILERQTVRHLARDARGVSATLAGRAVCARLVIGADGLGSRVRRWAGLEAAPRRLRRLGARQHFDLAPWTDCVEVTVGAGIEAYVTPCGPCQVGVALLWDSGRYRAAAGGRRLMPSLLGAFPDLSDRLSQANPLSVPSTAGPLDRPARRRTSAGVILLGDAGGYLDACTGEGITLALAQAAALETTVVPHLAEGAGLLPQAALDDFAAASRRIVAPYLTGTRLQLWLHRFPRLRERVIRSLAARPSLLSHVLSANMGETSFWPGWRGACQFVAGLC